MQQGFPFISVIAVIFLSFTTVFKILEVFAVISSEKGEKGCCDWKNNYYQQSPSLECVFTENTAG